MQKLITIFFIGFFLGAVSVVVVEQRFVVSADEATASAAMPVFISNWQGQDFARFRELVLTDHLSTQDAAQQSDAERLVRESQP